MQDRECKRLNTVTNHISVEPKPLPPVDENVSIPLRGSRKPTTLGVKTIGTVAEPSTVGVSSSVLKKEVEVS